MKKRVLSVILSVLLLAALIPGASVGADDGLSFIAVNDTLPPELINALVYYGGMAYIPAWLLTGYSLGVKYSYIANNSTAYLYNNSTQVFMELSTGKTYDSKDNEYAASAIMWGGTVYLPLDFIVSYFGTFTYRVIGSNEYGSILRIRNGNELVSDEDFFRAATAAMRRFYESWKKETAPTATPAPTAPVVPSASPAPSTPEPTEKPTREDDTIRLGLCGLPTEATLELLRRQNTEACFFLSAEEIRSDPDMVRRLACEGYLLGVSCPEGAEADCGEAAALLWETARVCAVLAATAEGAEAPENMVVYPAPQWDPEADKAAQKTAYSVTSQLDVRTGDQTLIFPTGGEDPEALRLLLYYLNDLEFSVIPIRETDAVGLPIVP